MAARLLRKTGEAIKHSPGALRRALSGNRDTYQMALEEAKDPFKVGLSFYVTYIGFETMDVVSSADKMTVDKVNSIVNKTIHAPRTTPSRRLLLVVSDTKMTFMNRKDAMSVENIPLYAIAYAGTHPLHDKVFTVLESRDAEKTTCHVMMCENVKMAQALVKVAAKAFQNAFRDWQAQQKREKGHGAARQSSTPLDGSLPNNSLVAGAPAEELQEEPLEEALYDEVGDLASAASQDEDAPAATGVGTEEKAEKLARHRSFYRRSCAVKNPDVLFTGDLDIKPDEFDLDDAKEFVQTLQNDTVDD